MNQTLSFGEAALSVIRQTAHTPKMSGSDVNVCCKNVANLHVESGKIEDLDIDLQARIALSTDEMYLTNVQLARQCIICL